MTKLNYAERLAIAEAKGLVHGAALVLCEEVKNPTPDRRHTHDWRKLPTIPAGKRFRVVETPPDVSHLDDLDEKTRAALVAKMPRKLALEPCTKRGWVENLQIHSDSDAALWDAIVPHLAPDVRSFEDVIWRADHVANCDAKDLLEALVKRGQLSFGDLDKLVDELAAEVVVEEKAS